MFTVKPAAAKNGLAGMYQEKKKEKGDKEPRPGKRGSNPTGPPLLREEPD